MATVLATVLGQPILIELATRRFTWPARRDDVGLDLERLGRDQASARETAYEALGLDLGAVTACQSVEVLVRPVLGTSRCR